LRTTFVPGTKNSTISSEKALPETVEENGTPPPRNADPMSYSLEENERDAIIKAYKASHGNLTKTARMLGIGRATLYRKLSKFGLENLKTG
jgi:two-component system response regulator AtoC